MNKEGKVKGHRSHYSGNSMFNTLSLLTETVLSGINTAIPVRVDKVESAEGADGPAGWVSATPLVCRLDGWNHIQEPVRITRLPYFRLQAGSAALVLDPQPGDMGLAVFAEADCHSLERGTENPRPQPPGSYRKFSKADGFYVGGFLNRTPDTWIQLSPENGKITVHSPQTVMVECRNAEIKAEEALTVTAPHSTFNGDVHVNGSIGWSGVATGDGAGGPAKFKTGIVNQSGGILNKGGLDNLEGVLASNGVSLEDHTHGGVQSGFNTTAGPVGRMEANDLD